MDGLKSKTAWRQAGRAVTVGASPRGHKRAGRHHVALFAEDQTVPVKRRVHGPPQYANWGNEGMTLAAIDKAARNVGRGWRQLPELIERGIRHAYDSGWLSLMAYQDGRAIYEARGYRFESAWQPAECHGISPDYEELPDVPMLRLRDAVAILSGIPDQRDGWQQLPAAGGSDSKL